MGQVANHRYADQLHREAGWMFRESARAQKVLGIALAQSKGWVSRQCNGHPSGPVARFYEMVRVLVGSPNADAGHVIAGAMAVAVDEALTLSVPEIRRRLYSEIRAESLAQSHEDLTTSRVDHVLARTTAAEATPEDFAELDEALKESEAALMEETARQVTMLIYVRALLVARGRRVAP